MKEKVGSSQEDNVKWLYGNLLQLRNEENKHYWDSVRLILASQAGLLAIYAVTLDKAMRVYPLVVLSVLISILGFGFSVLLYQIVKGGMYWVIYWQQQMKKLEEDKLRNIHIFASIPSRYQGKGARRALHPGVTPVDLSMTIRLIGVFLLAFWFCVVCLSLWLARPFGNVTFAE